MKQSPLERIIRFIGVRPRSTHEVITRLARYGVVDPAPIITQLNSLGFLDDISFAQWLVQSRIHSLRSPRAIRAELSRHHLSPAIISDSLAPFLQMTPSQILSLLRKKFGPPHRLSISEKARIIRYLTNRGFPWLNVSQVVKSYESE